MTVFPAVGDTHNTLDTGLFGNTDGLMDRYILEGLSEKNMAPILNYRTAFIGLLS